jgi:hypothetical protein
MEPIPPITPDGAMSPISKSKDGIVHCRISDDSAPRVRLFRQSVCSLRRIRTVQSEGDPNYDNIHRSIPLEDVTPRTRHRLLRILRTNSISESQDSSSDGMPSIQSLAHCSLPQAATKNIPCFSMMVDENPFRCEQEEETQGGLEDLSMISSMSPDSARLYLEDDNAGVPLHASPPMEIFVQRQRIPTEEWQDSWIRGVGPSSTPEQPENDAQMPLAEYNPSASSRPPPIVTVVELQQAPNPPPAPKNELKIDTAMESNSHDLTQEMNMSPVTQSSRPIVPMSLTLPSLSPLLPSTRALQRPKPNTAQNRAKTTTSHMVRRPLALRSSPPNVRKPRVVQKAQTTPLPPDIASEVVANDPLVGRLPRRRDPALASSVFSFGSIVGESTMITPMSFGSSESSSSFYMTEHRSAKNPPRRESQPPTTPLRLPVANVDIREDDEGEKYDHPMKVFETFMQCEHSRQYRKKTPLQNDLDYYWRQTKRFWYPGEKPVALQRNRSGCLT